MNKATIIKSAVIKSAYHATQAACKKHSVACEKAREAYHNAANARDAYSKSCARRCSDCAKAAACEAARAICDKAAEAYDAAYSVYHRSVVALSLAAKGAADTEQV